MEKIVKNSVDFTEGKVTGKIIKFVIPIIITGLLQMLYNASDMIVVGNLSSNGTNAMGGVGSSNALISVVVGLVFGVSAGTSVATAKNIGAKTYDNIKTVIDTSIIFSLILGVVVGVLGFIYTKDILILMGTPSEILSEAVPYMRAYFVGVPGNFVYLILASIVRSTGDSKSPLIILIVSVIFNVFANIFMVVCFNMDALGVGIATALSQYLSLIIMVIYLARKKDYLKLDLRNIKFSKSMLISIVSIGVPAGLQTLILSVSNVIIQSSINAYGPEAISGNSAAANLESFTYTAMNAFYQGVITIVGQNMGAKKYDRVLKVYLSTTILVSIVGLVMGLAIYIFNDFFLRIYEPNSQIVRDWGLKRLGMVSKWHFISGIFEVTTGVLRGMGKSTLSMLLTIIFAVLFRVVWIFTICVIFPNDINVLYLSFPLSWITTTVIMLACIILYYLKLTKLKKQRNLQKSIV